MHSVNEPMVFQLSGVIAHYSNIDGAVAFRGGDNTAFLDLRPGKKSIQEVQIQLNLAQRNMMSLKLKW